MRPTLIREQILDAARRYHTNRYAAEALGIHPNSFLRLCRDHGIESPNERRARERRAAENGRSR